MVRLFPLVTTSILLGGYLLAAQSPQAADVLKAARAALGGEAKLAAVKTVSATGRTRMTAPNGQVEEMDFALSMELPDKFMKREVLMAMGPTSVYRHSGFNGDALINEIDAPPSLSSGGGPGGGMWVRQIEVGPDGGPSAAPSPEEAAANRRRLLAEARRSFARLTLGMFASSFSGYPLTFVHAQALRRAAAHLDPAQHWQRECSGLAGAGLGTGDQVAAREHQRDRLLLDGSRGGVPLLLHRAQQLGSEAKVIEGHGWGGLRCDRSTALGPDRRNGGCAGARRRPRGAHESVRWAESTPEPAPPGRAGTRARGRAAPRGCRSAG